MMENAGRALAAVAIERFEPETVCVLAGTGGNGGGAMVAARHLANRGVDVSVVVTHVDRLTPVPQQQFDILQQMGVAIADEPPPTDLFVDGVIGYSLRGAPSGRSAQFIDFMTDGVVLSLDVPSGLDATTGEPLKPCVSATATMTLAAPKVGLRGSEYVGELYVADISVPPKVFRRLGYESAVALPASVVRVDG